MEIADQVGTPITVGQKGSEAALVLEALRVSLNKAIGEIDTAEGAEATLDAKLAAVVQWVTDNFLALSGLAANLNGGGFKSTNFADAVGSTDLTTLQQVVALIGGGGSPGDLPLASLGVGALDAGDTVVVNQAKDGLEAKSISAIEALLADVEAFALAAL